MSEFEKVFGDTDDLTDMIAILRDDFSDNLLEYIPESSLYSSPECVMYAIYMSLQKQEKIITSLKKEMGK